MAAGYGADAQEQDSHLERKDHSATRQQDREVISPGAIVHGVLLRSICKGDVFARCLGRQTASQNTHPADVDVRARLLLASGPS